MWTTGAGEMDLLVDRDMEGKELKTPKPLKVTWAGNMEFNGEEARFRDGVETRFSETVGAKQEQQSLDTNELVVVMEKKLDFQQGMAKGTGPKRETPKVAQLRCNGAVTLLQYLYDGNKLTASRELHTRAMRIDQLTGNIDAPGPGTVMSAQMGGENPLLTTSTAATPPPAVAPPKADPEKETINFLRVDFRERISGNMKTKELTFHEQVKAIYGPVPDFRTRLDTLNPDLTDEDRFLLTTDELTVRQVSRPNLPASMELETGLGDTTIEGQKFEAWASRLTYDQSKELITLYGDGLTEAWISHVARVGELRKQTQAGTIQYSKKNQTVTVGNFRHLDLSGMSQPKK